MVYPIRQGSILNRGETAAERWPCRVGLLSTWNQECGLATYARYLFSHAGYENLVVLAEADVRTVAPDETFVRRCWRRFTGGSVQQRPTYSELVTTIQRERIEVLHLNVHANFFYYPEFSKFLKGLRESGVKVVAQLHNTFTVEQSLRELVTNVDNVLVHTRENRLEVIANGADPDVVQVIQHGVASFQGKGQELATLRKSLGVPENIQIISSFGFIQPHKGMEAVLEAVLHLKHSKIPCKGYIIGTTREDDPNSQGYLKHLQQLVLQHSLDQDIEFITRYVSDDEVAQYLAASDLVVMNYKSQHFEASGACSLAVGAGAAVMTSLAPAMMGFGDAVWHLTAGYPAGIAAELILTNPRLKRELQECAKSYAEEHSWSAVAKKIAEIYLKLLGTTGLDNLKSEEMMVNNHTTTERKKGGMKILIQNRPQTFALRGGDTVVIEKLHAGLVSRGIEVKVDVDGRENPREYDLVHIFNFATPDITKAFAQNAKAAGTPYVVTTLYEDLPTFHNQSHYFATQLVQYVERDQDNIWWNAQSLDLSRIPMAASFDNVWVAENAAALICNGETEARALRRDYPRAATIVEVKLGHEVGSKGDPSLFINQFGLSDFIFCVGRFESRKNQLMVLKALEHVDVPVVLGGGGFSYQPEYDRAVRNFKRKGKTLILDRVSPEMLASAYAACKVHVLASWYELPGLVSLEAASQGKNVVVTKNGTAPDYLGDKAYYCSPNDEESVRNAVIAAYYSPVMDGLADCARAYTWENSVDATLAVYRKILVAEAQIEPSIARHASSPAPVATASVYDLSENAAEFQELLEKGELAAKNVDFESAHELLAKAEALNPSSVRVLKARGAILLAESKVDQARNYFDKALAVDPKEPKALAGRGMCEMMNRAAHSAVPYFLKALEVTPDHLVALHQMVECAYVLNSFEDLQRVLARYLTIRPDDAEMRYCYAGCLYKQSKHDEALKELGVVLASKPAHESAIELMQKIKQERAEQVGQRPDVSRANQSPRPIVSGAGIADSLSDLSKMVTEWKIEASRSTDTLPAIKSAVVTNSRSRSSVPTEVVVTDGSAEYAQVPTTSISLSNSSVPVAVPTDARTPGSGTQELPPAASLGGTDVTFLEIEDLKRERKFEEAGRQLDGVLNRAGLTSAQRARAQSTKAELMAITGDTVGADLLYDLILKEFPDFPRALCGKGALAAEGQHWDTARSYFERARALDPKYDVPLAGLAICEMSDNRGEEAFRLFTEANRLNPENHRAILGIIQLGYLLQEYGTIESAITTFLDHHPVNIDMMYSLAGVYFAQNKLRDAKAEVEKILLFEPANERAVELRGMIDSKWETSAATSQNVAH